MEQQNPEQKSDFMRETIKGRPISKRKLFKSTITTLFLALLFGLVAGCTFLFLQPFLTNMIQGQKEPETQHITFPEDPVEMEPEEMLAENLEEEGEEPEPTLNMEQIQEMIKDIPVNIDSYTKMYGALSDYVNEIKKSMVTVTTIDSDIDWLNNVQEKTNSTSGVIIANNQKELLILSFYEKLKEANQITVKFNGGILASAELSGYDADTGLAVLRVALSNMGTQYWADNVSIAVLGSTKIRNLETKPVIALGMPMGVEDSVGYGMITATTGQVQYTDANYQILQTDIFGSKDATGVLFNLQGEVIGIITNHKSENMENVIMAYGISDLKKRMEKLSNNESIPYIGLQGTLVSLDANRQLGIPYGAYIQDVEMNSPAMKAGFLPGDVITEMNGQLILAFSDYTKVLYTTKPKEKVSITAYRLVQDEYKIMKVELETDEVH